VPEVHANDLGGAGMSALDLDAIKARANAATPGPWSGDPTGTVCADADLIPDPKGGEILPADGPMEVAECYRNERPDERARNAEFIARAREDVPALLAQVERFEAARANLQRNAEVLADELVQASAAREFAEGVASDLRRRLKATSDACNDAQNRLYAVRMLKVWADKDGKEFVLASDLRHAIDPEFNPAAGGDAL
jgi:hypothetical protein